MPSAATNMKPQVEKTRAWPTLVTAPGAGQEERLRGRGRRRRSGAGQEERLRGRGGQAGQPQAPPEEAGGGCAGQHRGACIRCRPSWSIKAACLPADLRRAGQWASSRAASACSRACPRLHAGAGSAESQGRPGRRINISCRTAACSSRARVQLLALAAPPLTRQRQARGQRQRGGVEQRLHPAPPGELEGRAPRAVPHQQQVYGQVEAKGRQIADEQRPACVGG